MGARIYRALLRLLPGDFRSEFADPMRADSDAMGRGARWWTREIPGLVAAIAREHLGGWRDDVQDSLRRLTRTPGFTAAAVLMLAVGTGANAAVFSVANAAILRPGFPDAQRVVSIAAVRPDGKTAYSLSIGEWHALTTARTLAAAAAVSGRFTVLTGTSDDRRLLVECISAEAWDVMRVRPARGRTFTKDEDTTAAPVIVIGHGLWQQQFGGRPDVVGQTLTLDGRILTVVGVMPRGFLGVWAQSDTEAWGPLGEFEPGHAQGLCRADAAGAPPQRTIEVLGRIKPPFDAVSAAADVTALALVNGRALMTPTVEDSYDSYRGPLIALIGVVACVLLIACANVANLQLERLSARRRELAVRLALGASYGRIVRQTLIENVMLSAAGAICGIAAARLTLPAIARMLPSTMPNINDVTVDARVLAVTIAMTLAAGLGVGLVPAFQMLRARGRSYGAQLSTRGSTGGAFWTRRALVVVEVALSVALVIGAGLMVKTFLVLRPVDLGFAVDQRFTARTLLEGGWRPTAEHRQFVDDVLARLKAIPGVSAASASSYLPLSGYTARAKVRLPNSSATPATDTWAAWVTPNFSGDMDMRVVRGRAFSERDGVGATPVALINETSARQFFPDVDAVGRTIEIAPSNGAPTVRTIVGILADTRQGGRDRKQWAEVYVPYAQEPGPALLYFVLKTAGRPEASLPGEIKRAVNAVRPGQTVERLDTMEAIVERASARPRFGAWLFGSLAVIAAGLAALGLGAVIAWWVADRRREIGVRMALGASGRHAAALVMRQAMALTAIGAGIGASLAALFTRLLSQWLYGVAPTDRATFAAGVLGIVALSAIAAYLPARTASKIDPAITLRTE